jgi:hypothetical protein
MSSRPRHGQRRGRRLSAEEKVEILAKHKAGVPHADIARAHDLHRNSLSKILKAAAVTSPQLAASPCSKAEMKQPVHKRLGYQVAARTPWGPPRSIKAQPFSPEWWIENDRSFRSVFEKAHPELVRVVGMVDVDKSST